MGGLLYWWVFPPDSVLIERRIHSLVKLFPSKASESTFSRLIQANRIADHFTHDVAIRMGESYTTMGDIQGRSDLIQSAAAVRTRWPNLRFEVLDVTTTLTNEGQQAKVRFGLLMWMNQEPDPVSQTLQLVLRKEQRKWLIFLVEPEPDIPLELDVR